MESPADEVIGLYRRHAEAFDRLRTRALFEKPWLERFLGSLPSGPDVLDLGCGSGEPIGRYLIEKGCALTGVDTSPELLALCRRRFPGHQWVCSDMRELALRRRFHGVLAWDSFFFLPPADQRGMVVVFRKHLEPGGVLMFTSGPAAGVRIGTFEGEPLYHASLDEAEYRALLEEQGFTVLAYRAEDPECGGHTVWLAKLEPAATG